MRNVLLSTLAVCGILGAAALLAPPDAISKATGFIGTAMVNQGGTGVTTLTDGGVLLGSGTGNVTSMAVLASGEIIIGDGTTDPANQAITGDVTLSSAGAVTIVENAVDADMLGAMTDKIVLCGQIVDAGSVQTWAGPSVATYLGGGGDTSIGGTICNALDSETSSADADAPIDAGFPSFKVTGMQCIISAQPTNDVVVILHSAAAVVVPSVTCTITGGADTGCATAASTTTDIAAGATISIEMNYTEDLDADDIWCQLYFAQKAL
jgi:hypothetical protein